ncbi:MAG: tRNA uridine-5-carboxymethylaminomethyl(34) synthesis GTPase MnmE [Rickettsiales bacterium]|nr:tRNA uridine-5-carboxymethylaminomethyl(34) synthesis GTPase MnmE [Rickettsiales bacterium]OUV82628.1 MAG: tRNA uridine-5-carboxymethylaminomethyl(34) synthesis GTPase MnmE [Rickettsiales bacterium TMED131]|tara:strand:- start:1420 stop:2730 length:1311 start_codon:yes stop_codon:yes gene_type:complete
MQKTIFALATGNQLSALSIIRISGEECKNIIKKLTRKPVPKERLLTLRSFYFLKNKEKIIDTCLFSWMPGPRSYTGEDSLEIYTHGGEAVFQSFFLVLSSLKNLKYADQGEFSKRAIINGKINLVEAEAINDLIYSQTEYQRELAIRQYNKGLSLPLVQWRKRLINSMAAVEAVIDFSEEEDTPSVLNIEKDLLRLKKDIEIVLENNECYELVNNGIKVVFKGKPNAGKSSIFNAILKTEKSIVSNTPGTTRDIIHSKINYKGYVINFYDTAGITSTNNEIEAEGIRRAKKLIKEADIILNITENERIIKASNNKEWIILNKIDIKNDISKEFLKKTIKVSAKTGKGIKGLLDKIYREILLKAKPLNKENTLVANTRQALELKETIANIDKALLESSEEIIGEHLREANRSLERIIGNIDIEEVLGNIFSNFCIGK